MFLEQWLAQNKLLNSEHPALPCYRDYDCFQITTRAESSPDASRGSVPSASPSMSFSPQHCHVVWYRGELSDTGCLAARCCWWGKGPDFASGRRLFLALIESHGKSDKKLFSWVGICVSAALCKGHSWEKGEKPLLHMSVVKQSIFIPRDFKMLSTVTLT